MTIDFNYAMTQRLHHLLKNKQLTLAVAESCTGGALCRQITAISGSSAILDRGFIVYSNPAKMDSLGVQPDTIQTHGAVSAECALEMAQGTLAHSTADIAVSITGIAGPTGGSADKPVGTAFLAVMTKDKASAQSHQFSGGRKNIQQLCVSHALLLILEHIEAASLT